MPSIHERIREDLLSCEQDLWTAITSANPAPAVKKLCLPEANLIFPQMPILTVEGNPSLNDGLQPPFHRFDSYRLNQVRVIVVNLTAGIVTYQIEAARGGQAYNATSSSTWSQGADGEWRMACHQETI
ncbi:hypothetical protein AJ80_09323 [Polytolypa hystricis UAMH7299]|uniref:DUF4440 domain-containing protein n=1 Tax=Polytolypa hystricis (strain UAMH7299) TaxID=1447883 RepID=A0A2B7WSS3_POLH7|nr:hypothetical protein AJ80_09323 [Polytolypa hystricis UAMH7299]